MFCTPDLAARIERADGRLCAAVAEIARGESYGADVRVAAIAGGTAVFTRAGSPICRWMGAGFEPQLDLSGLDALEAHHAALRAPVTAWVSSLASPDLAIALRARGYDTLGFEHVLGHPLRGVTAPPGGIVVRHADRADAETVVEIIAAAFAMPDTGPPSRPPLPTVDRLRRSMAVLSRLDGYRGYVATIDGEPVGAATLWIHGELAYFIGAGTAPRFRRLGVQTALLRARLTDASTAGCTIGVVGTTPGSKSQQNAQREGFAVLYARQRLVKPAPASPPSK